jgi:hypothetical protein
MQRDFRASFLDCKLTSPCFSCEPKVRVAIGGLKFYRDLIDP